MDGMTVFSVFMWVFSLAVLAVSYIKTTPSLEDIFYVKNMDMLEGIRTYSIIDHRKHKLIARSFSLSLVFFSVIIGNTFLIFLAIFSFVLEILYSHLVLNMVE